MTLLLTLREAAALLGFSPDKVGDMCRLGQLSFIPLGRRHKRIARTEVERWVRDSQIHNGPAYRKAADGRRKS